MTVEKLKDWLNTMIEVACEINGDDYAERVHTGGGTVQIPTDIRRLLIKQNILECTDDRGCLYYFTGKYGKTVVEIAPVMRRERTYRRIDRTEERHKIMCLRLAKMLNETTAEAFEDMEIETRKKYIRMPYYSLVRPLLLADYAAGLKCAQLEKRYSVPYKTIYQWVKGR